MRCEDGDFSRILESRILEGWSYVGEESIIIKIGKEQIVRESDFSSINEIRLFRKKAKPWIDAGIVHRAVDSLGEGYNYTLIDEVRSHYECLYPSH